MRSGDQTFEFARGIWQRLRLKEIKEKSRIPSFILAKEFFFSIQGIMNFESFGLK